MTSVFLVPLAVFAMVVLIVAISSMVKVRDKELEVHSKLQSGQMEHQRKMKELEMELVRSRQGT
jgi:hypothetical protein